MIDYFEYKIPDILLQNEAIGLLNCNLMRFILHLQYLIPPFKIENHLLDNSNHEIVTDNHLAKISLYKSPILLLYLICRNTRSVTLRLILSLFFHFKIIDR